MEAFAVAVLTVFAVYGVITLVKEAAERLLRGSDEKVLIYLRAKEESLEAAVRELMIKNPRAEIIVIDEGKSREVREILDNLCRDFARVHIAHDSPR
jgi:hypothetical protein